VRLSLYGSVIQGQALPSGRPVICIMSRHAWGRRNAPLQRGLLVQVPCRGPSRARWCRAISQACVQQLPAAEGHHVGSAIGGSAGACIPKGAGGERMYAWPCPPLFAILSCTLQAHTSGSGQLYPLFWPSQNGDYPQKITHPNIVGKGLLPIEKFIQPSKGSVFTLLPKWESG